MAILDGKVSRTEMHCADAIRKVVVVVADARARGRQIASREITRHTTHDTRDRDRAMDRRMKRAGGDATDESSALLRDAASATNTLAHRGRRAARAVLALMASGAVIASTQPRARAAVTSALGAGKATHTITLSTACSPVDALNFYDPVNSFDWADVEARIVTKGMHGDFHFEHAVKMTNTGCGTYVVNDVPIGIGEEFGFYLHPSGDDSDFNTVLDIGCETEGGHRCPGFSSPAALATDYCTKPHIEGKSKFWNRRFDGKTTAYTWGACDASCGRTEAVGCSAPHVESNVVCSITIDNSIVSVKYGGEEIKADSGDPYWWYGAKKYNFIDGGPSKKLEVYGYEWDNCNGCGCAGLGVHCVSDKDESPWHEFVSDRTHWRAKVDTPADKAGTRVTNSRWTRNVPDGTGDTEYGTPCISGSAFSLAGHSHSSSCPATGTDGKYCKIWASSSTDKDATRAWNNMYVRFEGTPYAET